MLRLCRFSQDPRIYLSRSKSLFIPIILFYILLLISNHRGAVNLQTSLKFRTFKFSNGSLETFEKYRPRLKCKCQDVVYKENTFEPRPYSVNPMMTNSTCSPEATEAGENQKVVSYSFYDGHHPRNYTLDIHHNLLLMRSLYPGWLMRVYTDKPFDDYFCSLICDNQDDLFVCPIEFADGFDIGNVSREFQMQWRFLVLGDPTVERFLVRDLDSRISERELHAVREWENSGKIFHGMRDNPQHWTEIMGCCWGGNNVLLGDFGRQMQKDIVMNRADIGRYIDQSALALYVYPFNGSKSILTHDSYLCKAFKDSQPFPTQRVILTEFVGQPVYTDPQAILDNPTTVVSQCPDECRPSFGKDWLWC